MNAKQWLIIGGAVLVLIAVLGFGGIIGPTADSSIFGDFWVFTNPENYAHLVLGIAGLISAFVLPSNLQKYLVYILGVVALFFGVYSGFISGDFYGASLENPADTILHLAVGVWALYAASNTSESMSMGGGMM